MSTLLTGATGLIGSHLLPQISEPIIVTRDAGAARKKFPDETASYVEWNALNPPSDGLDLGPDVDVDRVVNLMGTPIADKRWTANRKRQIRESRVDGTKRLVEAIRKRPQLPKTWVAASAIGIYGSRSDEILTEKSPPGDDFLSEVCRDWENANLTLQEDGVRVVVVRIGIVLSGAGGALQQMLPIFRRGVGGPLASGQQWMSWIHLRDLVRLFVHALEDESVNGVLNGVSPQPVRNREFTAKLGKALGKPAFLPAPYFALRLVLGEFARYLVASQRVLPERTQASGFDFQFSELSKALDDCLA